MKKINDYNIFTKRFPHLDVHGETTDTIVFVLNDFINDNLKLGNKTIVIIHGIGGGILKNRVHELLSKHKSVKNYYLDNYNLGCTIIELF